MEKTKNRKLNALRKLWKEIDQMAENDGAGVEPMVKGYPDLKLKVRKHLDAIEKLVVTNSKFTEESTENLEASYYIWNCILGVRSVLWGNEWKD